MIDLTKGVNSVQGIVQKATSKVVTPKTVETAVDNTSKVADDIRKVEAIAQCAQALANVPDYVYDIVHKLNR